MTLENKPYDVVLHIGGPKTGSSALQNFFLKNRESLARAGYYYPEHGSDANGISGGHSRLGISLLNKQEALAEQVFNEYIDEANSQGQTLLLSAESFYSLPAVVRSLTNGLRCRVICFFRDPAEYVVSIYNQSVKRHYNTIKLETFCKRILSTEQHQASGLLIYTWAEHFGLENISLIEYQKPKSADASLEKIFLSELGIDSRQQAKFEYNTKPINRAYNESVLEFKRRLNCVIDKDSKPQNNKIDHVLQSISDNQSADRIENVATQVLKDTYVLLDAKFKDSNEKIRNDFFQGKKLSVVDELVIDQEKSLFSLLHFAEYLETIKALDKELDAYIRQCIEKKLGTEDVDYYVLSLAEAYGIDVSKVAMNPIKATAQQSGFNNMLVKQVLDNSRDVGVLLKVIAIVLERQGKFKQAFNVIKKVSRTSETEGVPEVLNRIKRKLNKES
ncbi:sulfotransferase domain-containing protein [Leucothrix mucor]|uniref:sulfotransferase domain-containing protein n=1 Tax=Leucothrix mucor TaxID=45248 RepID=UPI0003B77DCD|nr:sulfotransferase domain-containing protein [Leucothrix mucor]